MGQQEASGPEIQTGYQAAAEQRTGLTASNGHAAIICELGN